MSSSDILAELDTLLAERRQASPEQSYVARLHAGGPAAIGKKVGEEAAEVIIAGMSPSAEGLVHEVADLWLHSMVLLNHHALDASMVLAELQRRFGVSGLEEKAARAAEGK